MTLKAIVTIGIPASGKSSWAREQYGNNPKWVIVERDELRAKILDEHARGAHNGKLVWNAWKWKWEGEVTIRQHKLFSDAAKNKQNIIVSDTNMRGRSRDSVVKKLEELGYNIEFKEFPISFEKAVTRDAKRENGVGPFVIATFFDRWNKEYVRQYEGTPGKPKAVIVDIDGTLAKMVGRQPYDWSRVGEDCVHYHVKDVVDGLREVGYKIVVVSGRDGVCYEDTNRWLTKHEIWYDDFFMRSAGDMRPDTVIKEELFWEKIAENYDVKMAIDDRPKVCRQFRAMGINVLQVSDPYIEF